jgi:uncharacterized protein YcfL
MKHHIILSACCAVALSFLSACRLASEPKGTAQNTYVGDEGTEVEETFGSPKLAKELVMESILTERRDDRLFVQFNLRNTRSSNLAIEWAIEWFDASDFKLDTPHRWEPVSMGGKGYKTITQTAPTAAASGFRLGVRKPNTVR